MKYKFIIPILIFIYLGCNPVSLWAKTNFLSQGSLTGKVTDFKTGQPIPGAAIYIPDLKTGTVSDINGNYSITGLPESKLLVQVIYLGYKTIVQSISVSGNTVQNFVLEEAVSELSEIVVTGLSQSSEKKRTPTPITTIPSIQLQESSSTNIVDALTRQPGISQITTGASISKPVIRGLGFNRVVVVNDGIRQEGQQWGDEHGIEIDEFAVDHVEILKGPASLMYGSDAIAGVINFLSAPTLPAGTIEGELLANYQTNNGLFGTSLNIAGNNHDVIWSLRGSRKLAHAYQNNYDGYVLNSGFDEKSFSGITGLNKAWGYSHLHFSIYEMIPGIVEGDRDSLTGKFTEPVALNDTTSGTAIATDDNLKAYDSGVPYQKINHYKIVLNNNFVMGDGSLKAIVGWQQNQRMEFSDVFDKEKYDLYFLMNTINYDFRYVFPEKKGWNISTGINGMFQHSQNKGTEYLVPEYELFDAGVFGVIRKSFKKLDISGGLRFDIRDETGEQLFLDAEGKKAESLQPGGTQKFAAFKTTFNGVSGSIGATYQLSEVLFTKFNIARGFRAPNIAELGSNGEHEGSGRYEIGDPDLKAEHSLQFDYAFGINTEHVTGEINLFTNTISNFIFVSRLQGTQGADSTIDGLSVYYYTSGKANLSGGEISIDIHPHPLDWLHFENSFSYVQGVQLDQPDSAKYLPYIPAPKFTTEIKADTKKLYRGLQNSFVKLGFDYNFEQNNVYSVNNTETPTSAYGLLNFGAGTDLVRKNRTLFTFYISVNNLLDTSYQNHLSRLKYAPENYSTGRTGVYEMGRNFSFKVIVPFGIKNGLK